MDQLKKFEAGLTGYKLLGDTAKVVTLPYGTWIRYIRIDPTTEEFQYRLGGIFIGLSKNLRSIVLQNPISKQEWQVKVEDLHTVYYKKA